MDGQTTFLTEAEQDAAAERRHRLRGRDLGRNLSHLIHLCEDITKSNGTWRHRTADDVKLAEILLDVLGSSEDVYAIELVLAGEVTE